MRSLLYTLAYAAPLPAACRAGQPAAQCNALPNGNRWVAQCNAHVYNFNYKYFIVIFFAYSVANANAGVAAPQAQHIPVVVGQGGNAAPGLQVGVQQWVLPPISLANYDPLGTKFVGDILGLGSFGEVVLATRQENGVQIQVARKTFKTAKIQQQSNCGPATARAKAIRFQQKESDIMMLFREQHPCIIKFFGEGFQANGDPCLDYEFYPKWSMYELLKKAATNGVNVYYNKTNVINWMVDALVGLEYLHLVLKRGHMDIKPDNLLIDNDGNLIIADLGIAVPFPFQKPHSFTSRFAPPEARAGFNPDPIPAFAPASVKHLANGSEYYSFDSFSLAVVFLMILNPKQTFLEMATDTDDWIYHPARPPITTQVSSMPPLFLQIIGKMSCLWKNDRPTPSAVLSLPYFEDYIQNNRKRRWIRAHDRMTREIDGKQRAANIVRHDLEQAKTDIAQKDTRIQTQQTSITTLEQNVNQLTTDKQNLVEQARLQAELLQRDFTAVTQERDNLQAAVTQANADRVHLITSHQTQLDNIHQRVTTADQKCATQSKEIIEYVNVIEQIRTRNEQQQENLRSLETQLAMIKTKLNTQERDNQALQAENSIGVTQLQQHLETVSRLREETTNMRSHNDQMVISCIKEKEELQAEIDRLRVELRKRDMDQLSRGAPPEMAMLSSSHSQINALTTTSSVMHIPRKRDAAKAEDKNLDNSSAATETVVICN